MKRFASHYLYVPDTGFLKQHVIEVEEEYVVNFFPLTEEIESVEWMPGVIELVPEKGKLRAYLLYPSISKRCSLSPELSANDCRSNRYIK